MSGRSSNINNKNKEYEDDKYQIDKAPLVIVILLLFILTILVVGVSYQVYLYTTSGKSLVNVIMGEDNNIFHNGSVTIVYTEGDNALTIENAIPMTDEAGMQMVDPSQLMDFTITVNIKKNSRVSYEIAAEKDPSSTLDDRYVKLYLQKGKGKPKYNKVVFNPTSFKALKQPDDYGVPAGSMVLDRVSTKKTLTNYYRLRMWLDSSYRLDNIYRFFKIKINVYGIGERIKD